jgi:hypothetical protein
MALSKDEAAPFMFSKVDLKDGYWRMAVNAEDAWNFACVLPGGKPGDPVQLVIPDALQTGWLESPPFFCAATETARDVIQADMDTNSHVTKQPMEDIMMNGRFRVDPPVKFTLNNWDGQTLCPRTDCFKPYNTQYAVTVRISIFCLISLY